MSESIHGERVRESAPDEAAGQAAAGVGQGYRKQMEGNNQQRRKAAREARKAGNSASEAGMTSGGSK